jgi:predicted nucleic acid-binding protein
MNLFIDTSAFLAILNSDDLFHIQAKSIWMDVLSNNHKLACSNYILVETIALLQTRSGLEAVRIFENRILPVIDIVWIDELTHQNALRTLILTDRRRLSLVDCTSFEILRNQNFDQAFTFDSHFYEAGFSVLPTSKSE